MADQEPTSLKNEAETGIKIFRSKFRGNILRENLTQKLLNPGFTFFVNIEQPLLLSVFFTTLVYIHLNT